MSVSQYKLKIVPDENYDTPDDWGNDDMFLVADISRYLSVKPPKGVSDDPETLRNEGYLVFPVRAYVHSGVALALAGSPEASGYPFTCKWDSGWAGFVVVNPEEAFGDAEWQEQHHPGKTPVQIAQVMAENLIKTWNHCLSGDVWGFQVIEMETCSLGHTHETVVESCYGFYGQDDAEEQGKAALETVKRAASEAAPTASPTAPWVLTDPMYHEVLEEALAESLGESLGGTPGTGSE